MIDPIAPGDEPIRLTQVSTQDQNGGAFRSSYRLHQGLRELGVDSKMVVQRKVGDDESVYGPGGLWGGFIDRLRGRLDRAPLRLYPDRETSQFTVAWLPRSTLRRIDQWNPDLVHLHWVARGGADIAGIGGLNLPVVWTLHDMWAFTGGCHYSGSCDAYRSRCGACPQLGSSEESDLSRGILRRKERHWSAKDLTIVCPSRWLAECARDSSLFRDARIEVIPYGLDLDLFRPIEQARARSSLGLSANVALVLFGALQSTTDTRKGFHLLEPALRRFSEKASDVELVVFGAAKPESPPKLGFPIHYLGHIAEDRQLAAIYSAADVFVAPSVQDNLPNTVLEATACGTPTVAFDIGGMPDMVEHRHTGYLAEATNHQDLARGIAWVLRDPHRAGMLGRRARAKAERDFSLEQQARRYLGLYGDVLDAARRGSG